MNIPENVALAQVEGNLLAAVLDSRDADNRPNAEQLKGLKATVTALEPIMQLEDSMLVLQPFVFETNQAGDIINPRSPDDAPMIPATDQPDLPGVQEFRYQVELTWLGQQKPLMWRAAAPSGGVLNLSRIVDPPAPEQIPAWEHTLAEVAAAREAVLGHRDAVAILHGETQGFRNDAELFRDQASAIASGDIIDDVTPSPVTVFSSQRVAGIVGDADADLAAYFRGALVGDEAPWEPAWRAEIAQAVDDLDSLIALKAALSHTHSAADITTGTVDRSRLPSATTTARGSVELATSAETAAGADASRAVTPAGLAAALASGEAVYPALNAGYEAGPVAPHVVVDHAGFVHLTGRVDRVDATTSPIFTLPVGARPAAELMFAGAASRTDSAQVARFTVGADGVVRVHNNDRTALGWFWVNCVFKRA